MPELSPQIEKRSRKNLTAALGALADVGQNRVADLMGLHESTVSAFKGDKLQQACIFLAACGLKLVPETALMVDPTYIQSLKNLAGVGLAAPIPHGSDD